MIDPRIEAYRRVAAGQAVTLDAAASQGLADLIRDHVTLKVASDGGPLCPECGPLRVRIGGVLVERHFETCRLGPFLPCPTRR